MEIPAAYEFNTKLAFLFEYSKFCSKQEKAEIRHNSHQTKALAGFVYKCKAELRIVSAKEEKHHLKISCCRITIYGENINISKTKLNKMILRKLLVIFSHLIRLIK